jgi:hypothetical protein
LRALQTDPEAFWPAESESKKRDLKQVSTTGDTFIDSVQIKQGRQITSKYQYF